MNDGSRSNTSTVARHLARDHLARLFNRTSKPAAEQDGSKSSGPAHNNELIDGELEESVGPAVDSPQTDVLDRIPLLPIDDEEPSQSEVAAKRMVHGDFALALAAHLEGEVMIHGDSALL